MQNTFLSHKYSQRGRSHRYANGLSEAEWQVPAGYYDQLLNRLPIDESMYICGNQLMSFVNSFHCFYALQRALLDGNRVDTVLAFGQLKYVPDTLLRQMVLAEQLNWMLDRSSTKFLEAHRTEIESVIHQTFLLEPLFEKYGRMRERLENPKTAADATLKKLAGTNVKEIVDSVLTLNKGKVIYVDCWATWCGPCRAEMPNSKKLMKDMAARDVVFVFLCLESAEGMWKAIISELQLGGQHYLLDHKQSQQFRETFGIQGVPFYILIDKNGKISESGTWLRPKVAKDKILGLLTSGT